jgi:TonB family protein
VSQLEKRCLVGSATLHALLLLIFVVASAWIVPPRKAPEMARLRVVPGRLVDDLLAGGGGNPNIKPNEGQQKGQMVPSAPAQAPVSKPKETVKPQQKPPEPAPEPVRPPPVVKKVEPKTKPTVKPEPVKPEPAKPDKLPIKEIVRNDTKPVKPPVVEKTQLPDHVKETIRTQEQRQREEQQAREAAARENAARVAAIGRTFSGVRKDLGHVREGFAGGTVVEASGPGGEAYANYDAYVREKYDNEWTGTDDIRDEYSTTRATVTIANTGEVVSARVITPSRNPALDRSVERVLRSVRFIAPFPDGTREKTRTYTINFNVKAKRGAG